MSKQKEPVNQRFLYFHQLHSSDSSASLHLEKGERIYY